MKSSKTMQRVPIVLLLILVSIRHHYAAADETSLRALGTPTRADALHLQRELKNNNKNNKNGNEDGNGNGEENAGNEEDHNSEDGEHNSEDEEYDEDEYIYSQMNAYNNGSGKNGTVWLVFLALFAGVAVGIVAAAHGMYDAAKTKFQELKQKHQEKQTAQRARSLKENLATGEDIIITSFSEQETGQEGIGTPAIVQMTSLKTNVSADFGGGYVAPQEHTQVNILYNV